MNKVKTLFKNERRIPIKDRLEMSESLVMGILLALSGGFLDTYSYICRDKVFANAQTGNIVLLGLNIAEKKFSSAFNYLLPILAFIVGILMSELIKTAFQNEKKVHWRQIVLVIEILSLIAVANFPQKLNMAANITVSFVCAIQIQTFKKFKGNSCATTMCTGNLRTATELMCTGIRKKDKSLRKKSRFYFFIDFIFLTGAVVGTFVTHYLREAAVLFPCSILFLAFIIMFLKDQKTQ